MEERRHTSSHYEMELQEIKNGLIYIGVLTETAIQMAMKSLTERDSDMHIKSLKMMMKLIKWILTWKKDASGFWPCVSPLPLI